MKDKLCGTVFITGTSSGIGKACAILFAKKGWNVIACQRNVGDASELGHFKNIKIVSMDVTDQESIEKAIKVCLDEFGQIDVLVNNAGRGMHGVFEAASNGDIEELFNVNVFGMMRVTKALLPHFRERGGGRIVNISSMGGRIGLPLRSVYDSSKFAVEGFSEVLMYELKPFNISVKIIEPGFVKSKFHTSLSVREMDEVDLYRTQMDRLLNSSGQHKGRGSSPDAIAETVYRASIGRSNRLRYAAGADAKFAKMLNDLLPFGLFSKILSNRGV